MNQVLLKVKFEDYDEEDKHVNKINILYNKNSNKFYKFLNRLLKYYNKNLKIFNYKF